MQANGKREARYLACGGSKTRPRWIARDVAHESDCNVRRDDSSAASVQREQPVNERGRLHGASELLIRVEWREARDRMDMSSNRRERRWRKRQQSHGRLRLQGKSTACRRADCGCGS